MIGGDVFNVWAVARAELVESLGRPLRHLDDLRVAFTPGPGADHVPGREDHDAGEFHELFLTPCSVAGVTTLQRFPL
jgi:hypothetical protein